MSVLAWFTLATFSTAAHAMPDGLWAELDPQVGSTVIEVAPGLRKTVPEVPANKQGAIRHAITRTVDADLTARARWQTLSDGRRVGQVRVLSPTAASVSLSFERAWLPPGGKVWLEAANGTDRHTKPITAVDTDGGALFMPLVRADELLVTIVVPPGAPDPVLDLTGVHVGVRPFGTLPPPPQGSCNVDVVCPDSAGWEAEIDSVAVYGFSGDFWCTGFMLNNTSEDQTPYFATAHHCGLDSGNTGSVTIYWNYESENCGDLSGGRIRDYQTGATWRMEYRSADWTLIELDAQPDPAFEVAWAGWDRSGNTTSGAVAIHHPGTDEKAISFENDPTTVTWDYDDTPDSSGTHVRVDDWDLGTTEGGSSGSPLFDPDHRVIGALTGGWAACGNNEPDWYGRLYTAWTGDGSSDGRLSNWLDPSGTGQTTTDTLAPHLTGVSVLPTGGLASEGREGGSFAPRTESWTLLNRNETSTTVTVSADVSWVAVSDGSLTLASGAEDSVQVSISEAAESLTTGRYEGTLTFATSDGADVQTRDLSLLVGTRELWYGWNLDEDPGWSTTGDWAWGVPEGGGGRDEGYPDPTEGATGSHVYGYNLAGDYDDRERARYLTTDVLDFSDALGTELRFQRWLGVEESAYDNASIEVSGDGGRSWETVWANEGEVADRSWSAMAVDISSVADGSDAVQVRWVMGSTDESVTYCGWNIDDIEFYAIGTPPVVDEPGDTGEPDSGDPDTAEPEDSGEPVEPDEPEEPVEDTAVDPVDVDKSSGEVSGSACSSVGAMGAGGWLVVGLGVVGLVRRRG